MSRLTAIVIVMMWSMPAHAAGPRVMAASSLTDALTECAARFRDETGAEPPVLSFSSSSKLARQVQAGAAADLVLTADSSWMDVLEVDGHLDPTSRRALLQNDLALVVPRGSWSPQTIDDLTRPELGRIAIAGEAVPAGRRAREVLRAHGLTQTFAGRTVVSTSARATLGLVARDEVDAGIVYRSDAHISDRVDLAFLFSSTDHAPILYPLALTTRGADDPQAVAFYTYLLGPEASAVFQAAGFRTLAAKPLSTPTPFVAAPLNPGGWGPVALSLWVAFWSLCLSLPPGIGLGWLLARRKFFGKTLVTILAMSPLVLPPVVTGFLLLRLFGRNGLFGPTMHNLGLEVAFTRWGAVIAAAVVGFPLLVQLVRQAIEAVDPRYEQMAQSLGRHPVAAFLTVTLPLALPGIAAGAVLSFTRALGEFGATAVLAGDVPGETRTLALAVFANYETPGQEAAAMQLVWISLALCAVSLAAYELLTRLQRQRLEV